MKTKQEKIKLSEKPPTKTLPVSDNLQLLKVYVPDIPKDIIFPDELNRYLRDQIQYLHHQNGMLEKNLSEVEVKLQQSTTKITTLNAELDEYQSACPKNSLVGCTTANFASSKIVELSKKLRERNSEMEIYKTKCSKLEKCILDFESKERGEVSRPKQVNEKPKNELEDQIKSLQEKVSTTSTKLYEAKNFNVQLKNDLKMANKLLQQEVGESFDAIQSLNSNGNWRGRAQVVRDLQQKNNELREKLKGFQDVDRVRNEISPQVSKLTYKLENLTKENLELKESFQDVKKKLETSKARSKVFESDCSIMRSKINKILEENDHYRETVAALTGKVARAQDLQNEAVNQKQVFVQKLESEKKSLQMENSKQLCKIENCQTQIEELRRECERQKNKNRKSLSPVQETEIDNKAQVYYEAERLRLVELTKLAKERLETERAAHSNIQLKYREERQKVAKLESKVARLQLDQKTDRSSNYSTFSLKSKETDNSSEDRLELAEETIKALDTRLQIERQERQFDIEKFSQILNNSHFIQSSSQMLKCNDLNVE